MIKKIHIENYILITSLDISFESGLNTITGETGAGKSIILGAISLILGGRGEISLLRNRDKNLVLEIEFAVDNISNVLRPIFDSEDVEFDERLTIRRIITPSGKSKCYVNDEPVTVTFLRSIAPFLVDIHSQHQTLLLSNSGFQTHLLDLFSGGLLDVKEYSKQYREVLSLRGEIACLKEKNSIAERESDYINYLLEQLITANLSAGEKELLEWERDTLANASMIGETLFCVNNHLSDGENSVISSLQSVNQLIDKVENYLPNDDNIQSRLISVLEELKDINRALQIIGGAAEDNPLRLAEVEERLDTLNALEHRHNVSSVEELIALRDELQQKSEAIEGGGDILRELEVRLELLEASAWDLAAKIHTRREDAKADLSGKIINYLTALGMPNAQVYIEVKYLDKLTDSGADDIYFTFAANKGGRLEGIEKVASGGEMSRLMLALKAIASADGTLPTVIFDEIDAGVSGKVADMMGDLIEKLSENMQVINITHLPQIASKGEHHYYVYKEESEEDSRSGIVKLSHEERVKQIAIMISGNRVTDAAIKQAELLLTKQK